MKKTDPIFPELIKDFGLEEINLDKLTAFHLVYETVFKTNGYSDFALLSFDIKKGDTLADLISKTPQFIEKFYDSGPMGAYSFWLKLPEKYQDHNYAVTRNTELGNNHD